MRSALGPVPLFHAAAWRRWWYIPRYAAWQRSRTQHTKRSSPATPLPSALPVGKRPDERALQAVLGEVLRLLESPGMDPAVARAAFFVAAAAARGSSAVRKQLATAVQRAIAEADEAATGALPVAKLPRRRSAATDWDLQHTVFAASRVGGTATGSDEISRSFGVGVASGDAVGARHALAMGAEVAFRVSSVTRRASTGFAVAGGAGFVEQVGQRSQWAAVGLEHIDAAEL